MADHLVIDASAMVDVLIGSQVAAAVTTRLRGGVLHAPAHFDAEVFSALGRLNRAGTITESQVKDRLRRLADLPLARHDIAPLLIGAWGRRDDTALMDALYIELANQLDGARVITTDRRLAARRSRVEFIEA